MPCRRRYSYEHSYDGLAIPYLGSELKMSPLRDFDYFAAETEASNNQQNELLFISTETAAINRFYSQNPERWHSIRTVPCTRTSTFRSKTQVSTDTLISGRVVICFLFALEENRRAGSDLSSPSPRLQNSTHTHSAAGAGCSSLAHLLVCKSLHLNFLTVVSIG